MITSCSHTFDRVSIIEHIRKNKPNPVCPLCRAPLFESDLKPNINLKSVIEDWKYQKDLKRTLRIHGQGNEMSLVELKKARFELENQIEKLQLKLERKQIEYDEIMQKILSMDGKGEKF